MIVYLDTNIIIDIISLRQPHYADSQAVLDRCSDLQCKAFVGWHGVATAYYTKVII
jgi:predicted nucleic acid-binding protein